MDYIYNIATSGKIIPGEKIDKKIINVLENKVITNGNGCYLVGGIYIAMINKKPIATYKTNRGHIHIIFMDSSRYKSDYVISASNILKYCKGAAAAASELLSNALNKHLVYDNKYKTICID